MMPRMDPQQPFSPTLATQVQRLLSQLKFAAKAWREWNRDKSLPADRWLARIFAENRKVIGSRDRRFISGCVHEVFRNQSFYDYWIQKFAQSDIRDPVKYAKFLCLFGAVEDRSIDKAVFAAAWNEIKDQANLEQHDELFHIIREHRTSEVESEISRSGWLALRYSFPGWIVERWLQAFGDQECEAILRATHQRPPLVIRANTLKISREKLITELGPEGGPEALQNTASGISFKDHAQVKNSPLFMEGYFEIQSEASQRVVELVHPLPGEKIWDVCAGGGGKTLFLAALMKNEGVVIATDLRSLALKELKLRAARAGAENIKIADVQRFYNREAKDQFDKIVIDAPCSGTGTLGRAPDLKWRIEEKTFEEYAAKQLEILEMALPYLKQTGQMFYMTCSIDPSENEEVVKSFLSRHSELKLKPISEKQTEYFRIWPQSENTDGFFTACFIFKDKETT